MEQILKRLDMIDSKLELLEAKVKVIETNYTNGVSEENIVILKKKDNYMKYIDDPNFRKLLKKKSYSGAAKIYEYIFHKTNFKSPIKVCKNEILLYYDGNWKITTTNDIIKIIIYNIRFLYIQLSKNITDVNEFTLNQEYIIKLSEQKFKDKFKSYLIKLEKNRLI